MQWNKASAKILAKYSNYTDVLFLDSAMELLKNTEMNKNAIELIDRKQPLYEPIYAFCLVELETLKIYIEIYLKTGFIQPFKSPLYAFILFNKKFYDSLYLCINY